MASESPNHIQEKHDEIQRAQKIRQLLYVGGVLATIGVVVAGLVFLKFTIADLVRGSGGWFTFLDGFVPPNFVDLTQYTHDRPEQFDGGFSAIVHTLTNPGTIVNSVLSAQPGRGSVLISAAFITVLMGFLGTALGFPLALVFGILGSERVVPFPYNFIFRGTMSTIRAIPAIIWGLIYVPLTGLGPVTAVLAIGTDTIGNMGRLFTDELEEIDQGPIEAIRSTGGSRPQVVIFGMLSQVYNGYIAWVLYVLEINTRIAISMGVIGVGGLGRYIDLKINLGATGNTSAYPKAAAGILMVVFIVLTVELTSSRIRSYLRPGENEGKGFFEVLRSLGDPQKWLGTNKP